MSRVNRTRMAKIKLEWEVKKMMSAYIAAERTIIEENSKGNDITGSESAISYYSTTTFEPMTPQEFFSAEVDAFGNLKNVDEKSVLLEKAMKVRELLDKAIANDEFEKAQVYQRTLDILQEKYDKL